MIAMPHLVLLDLSRDLAKLAGTLGALATVALVIGLLVAITVAWNQRSDRGD